LKFRRYQSADKETCLAIFLSNVPKYFFPYEEVTFLEDLEELAENFLVVTKGSKIIACGGYHVDTQENEAWLCWTIVAEAHHRKGAGRALTVARLWEITQAWAVPVIRVDTQQYSLGFFERMGFKLDEEIPDGYGPGLNCYELELKVDEHQCGVYQHALQASGIEWCTQP
jgi:N-acetylglutamate synthase-like GNAT family acetyltransferase